MAPALEKLTAQQEHVLLTLVHLLKGDILAPFGGCGERLARKWQKQHSSRPAPHLQSRPGRRELMPRTCSTLTLTSGPLLVLFPVIPVLILCFLRPGPAQVSLRPQHLLPPLEPVLTTYNTITS